MTATSFSIRSGIVKLAVILHKEISERKKLLKNLKNVRRVDCFAVSDHAAGKYRALQRTEEKFNRGVEEGPFVKSIEYKLGILHEF